MTANILQIKDSLLWPLSIATGLLLQITLASFLWSICTSYDKMQPPALRLISLSPTVVEVKPVAETSMPVNETTVTEPEPVIEEMPVIETQPISQPEAIEPEPIIETIPTIPEPVKALPEVIKRKVEPIKAKPRVKPVKKPQKQIISPVPTVAVETVPAAKPLQTNNREPIAQRQAATPAQATTIATALPVAASPKDFSGYLQKIYHQLEHSKKYPASARRRGITGKVAVAFSINSEGKAIGATVTSKSPRELADAASNLVSSQRFASPPDGWSTDSRIEMQINYSLR